MFYHHRYALFNIVIVRTKKNYTQQNKMYWIKSENVNVFV